MAVKAVSVKKYVVRLSKHERSRLRELIGKGKSPAKLQLKARILLLADVSSSGKDRSITRAPISSLAHRSSRSSMRLLWKVRTASILHLPAFCGMCRRHTRAIALKTLTVSIAGLCHCVMRWPPA